MTPEQKRIRQVSSETNLAIIKPENSLTQFVNVDETWVHHYDPKSKRQSME